MSAEIKDVPMVTTWRGRPIQELDKDELIQLIEYCGEEIKYLRKDRDRWRKAGDSLKYLMHGGE